VKLLRVLQEREFQRLGGTHAEKADVRFVAATHRDLEKMVSEGTFREDLFYRLNVVPVRMPALRERKSDIEVLAKRFAADLGKANGRGEMRVDAGALAALTAHEWPGNVRELQNLIERIVVFADGATITAADVQRELAKSPARAGVSVPAPASESGVSLDSQRAQAEKQAIRDALVKAQGNRTQAARLLGISRRTLYNKLDELDIA
jgi:DNA-binding NtrC family response regulator